MVKIPSSQEAIKLITANGWRLQRIKGSHHHFTHPIKKGLVTIKHPCKDIPLGTWANIKRQAGL
ncbi:MAG: type II toxin-antitoxin system HicA family toxin [Synergistaceae bacterium]|nr:type II toxin-antitoxin system HicA family toxin [Synergistaceae bacterium]